MRELITIVETAERLTRYRNGMCDVMALALHRLTGLPLGIIYAVRTDDMFDDQAEELIAGHAVVILGENRYLDITGEHDGLPEASQMVVHPEPDMTVRLVPASEEEVREAFTVEEIDEAAIEEAIEFARHQPALQRFIR